MVIFLLFFYLLLLVINYPINGPKFFSPSFITTAVWIFVLLLLLLFGHNLYPISEKFAISIIIWGTVFCLGSRLFTKFFTSKVRLSITPNITLVKIYYLIIIILSPFYFYVTYTTIFKSGAENLIFSLRNQDLENKEALGSLIYLRTLVKATFLLELFQITNRNRNRLLFIILLNVLFALSNMEKGYLIFLIMTSLYYLHNNKVITGKSVSITLIILIGLAYLFNTLRWHNDATGYDFFYFLSAYIAGPSIAFGTLEILPQSSNFGANTLAFFYALSNSLLGTTFDVESKMQEFVSIPVPTNVYTILQPFYEDFGYVGVLIFAILLCLFSTYFYKKSLSKHPFYLAAYSFIIVNLFMQFFQDEFFISFSVVLQFFIILYLPFFVSKFYHAKK